MPTAVSVDAQMWSGFTVVDYVVFITMLVASVCIGVYSAVKNRGQESTQNYLLGGRAMSPFPVALSLIGGTVSANSVLGVPTEVYLHGTQVYVIYLSLFTGLAVVYTLVIPTFFNLRLASISEYLVLRYKSAIVHKLGSVSQIVYNFFHMGIVMYTPSLALSTATNLSTTTSVIVMGLVCTFYMTVGGVKAVVYTDVLQTLLMFAGVLLVVILCCVETGGVSSIWSIADQGARIEFLNTDLSPFVRHSLWSTVVYGFLSAFFRIGFNQNVYQRLASVGTLTTARRLSVCYVLGFLATMSLFSISGLVAYAIYYHCDPFTSGRIQKADQIFPYLVIDKLGHLKGIPGIFVAAIYGAVLSSISSLGNSIACLIWEDLLKDRPYFRKMNNTSATNVLKLLSAAMGLFAIALGFLVSRLGTIVNVAYSINGAVMGPLAGIYMAGLLTPWVNTKGAVVGFVAAFSFNIWLIIGKFLRGGGSPPHLPLSTDGCPENVVHLVNITSATLDTLLIQEPPIDRVENQTVYDISYCYTSMMGFLITLVVSNLVSFCTGPLSPEAVGKELTCSYSTRLHQRLWRVWYGCCTTPVTTSCKVVAEVEL